MAHLKAPLFALLAGLLFGLGMIVSGMTNPAKVQGFLNVFGAWDPSLALVMAGGIAVAALAFARARQQKRSWSGAVIALPQATGIDSRLLLGGALFGVGWGLSGLCPGPALVAMASGWPDALIFGLAMLVGMVLHDTLISGGSPTQPHSADTGPG
jgi:uncharacterized protein